MQPENLCFNKKYFAGEWDLMQDRETKKGIN
jgi:hypothetical protein